jgi:membrane protein YdbS with pleckstrin-like domain
MDTMPEVLLRAPAHLVSSRARTYWTVRALPGWLFIGGWEALILLPIAPTAALTVPIVLGTALLAALHLVVMPQWRYRVHRWEVTDSAVYTQSGWFNQERRIAPIARVQTVDTERGPFEQLFGLAKVTVTTASAAGPLHIHGLDLDVARQLVDDLTAATEASEGDAT